MSRIDARESSGSDTNRRSEVTKQKLARALGRSMVKDPGFGTYSRKTRVLAFLVGGRKLYKATRKAQQ